MLGYARTSSLVVRVRVLVRFILHSYNMGTRDMTEIYARLPRARGARGRVRIFQSYHVITVIFHTLEVESIISIIVKL